MLLNGKKQKTVIRFCATRENVVKSVPLTIFCVYDSEERGSSECGARERNLNKASGGHYLGAQNKGGSPGGPGHLGCPGAQVRRE